MSEKGGKGFSIPKSGKSALKTPASKGKDDSSAKSQKTRMKVQFDSEDSLEGTLPKSNGSTKAKGNLSKSNGKTPATEKGDWGKGLKEDKTAKAGKAPATKPPPPPLELRVEEELSRNTKCLMDCEAAEILQGIQDNMTLLSADPTIKIPISFDRGLMYAKRGSHYSNPATVRKILEPLKKHGVVEGEICLIANICPESVEDVFALVPSLKSEKAGLREALIKAVDELAKQKTSA